MSAYGLTVFVTLALLSAGVGSVLVDETTTDVLPRDVAVGHTVGYGLGTDKEMTKVTITDAPSSTVPRLQGNFPSLLTDGQFEAMLESFVPGGSVAFSWTPVALLGPAFAIITI
jgi:hypothetical protein